MKPASGMIPWSSQCAVNWGVATTSVRAAKDEPCRTGACSDRVDDPNACAAMTPVPPRENVGNKHIYIHRKADNPFLIHGRHEIHGRHRRTASASIASSVSS